MSNLSSTDMAFSGFELVLRKPLMIAAWGGVYLAFSLTIGFAMIALFGPQLIALANASQDAQPDPAVIFAQLGRILPLYLLAMVFVIGWFSVIVAATYRAMLRPEQGAPFHISFGAPELLQILVMFILSLMFMCVYIVGLIAAVIVGVLGAFAAKAAGGGAEGPIMAATIALAIAVVLGAMLIFAVRFSLAGPATFMSGNLVLLDSWTMTRGNFWTIFGGYVLNWAIILMVYVVVLIAIFLPSLGSHGFSLQALQDAQLERLKSPWAMFAPAQLALSVVLSFVNAALYAVIFAPAAYAYREIQAAKAGAPG